jgi:hypothetical protein
MPPKPGAEEKLIAELKKLSKLEGNKTCAECPERMPGYVNLSHKTFVCTKCAGMLRDLQFKIKGISMSKFTKEDLDEMASGGNLSHNGAFLAKWPAKDPLPNGQDPSRLKEHIRLKYIEMRWKERDGFGSGGLGVDDGDPEGGGRDLFLDLGGRAGREFEALRPRRGFSFHPRASWRGAVATRQCVGG